jgi:hypothetical protein
LCLALDLSAGVQEPNIAVEFLRLVLILNDLDARLLGDDDPLIEKDGAVAERELIDVIAQLGRQKEERGSLLVGQRATELSVKPLRCVYQSVYMSERSRSIPMA